MRTYFLKLLISEFNKGLYFERLPDDIIEYILKNYIMNLESKKLELKYFPELRLKGVFYRIQSVWNLCFNTYLKLQVFDINFNYNFNLAFKSNINDHEYILHILNTCQCCSMHQKNKPHNFSYTRGLIYSKETTNCECLCNSHAKYIHTIFKKE